MATAWPEAPTWPCTATSSSPPTTPASAFPRSGRWGCRPTNMWLYHLGPQWTKRLLFTGDTVSGDRGRIDRAGAGGGTRRPSSIDHALALAARIALVGRDLLAANKRVVNEGVELMGRSQLQRFAALNDAVAHRTPEARAFTARAGEVGLKQAVRERDAPFEGSPGDPPGLERLAGDAVPGAPAFGDTPVVWDWTRDPAPPRTDRADPEPPHARPGGALEPVGRRRRPPRRPARGLDPAAPSTPRWPAGSSAGSRRDRPSHSVGHGRTSSPDGDVLVASPTGTGKTLTGFLVAIDAAYRAACRRRPGTTDAPSTGPGVVYVSPLRALAVDVHENLQLPLAGIADEAARLGLAAPALSVAVRTGDTPTAERAAMRRSPARPAGHHARIPLSPPHRGVLHGPCCRASHTVIVDEVHTLARDKRGSHLALSLERLSQLVSTRGIRLQRIGLSATQRPLEVVADLLSGTDPSRPHHRHRGLRPPAGPRRGHRAPRERARGGGQWPSALRRARPHRRPRPRAPHHAGLRQHPQDGRAGRPSAGHPARIGRGRRRAGRPTAAEGRHPGPSRRRPDRRRPAGGRPPRQPLDRPAPDRRTTPAGGRPAGFGGHRLARAGHRRRSGRAGVPDRVSPGHRHLPPAGGTGQPPARGHPGRTALPAHPRRVGRMHRSAGRGPGRAPRRAATPGRPARRPGPAVGGRSGGGRRVGGRAPLRPGPVGGALRRSVAGGLRRGGRDGLVGDPHRPGPAGRPPPPRRGQRPPACPARRTPGRAHQRGRHPRDR